MQQIIVIMYNITGFEWMRPDRHSYMIPTTNYAANVTLKRGLFLTELSQSFDTRLRFVSLFDRGIVENLKEFFFEDKPKMVFDLEVNSFVSQFCQTHNIALDSFLSERESIINR